MFRIALLHCLKILPLLLTFWASDAVAYPWMLKHGYAKCSTCHTDPSGGETLSHMGRVQADALMTPSYVNDLEGSKLLFGIDEPDAVRLGGSLRYLTLYSLPHEGVDADLASFPMQADVYGTGQFGKFRTGLSLGYADVPAYSPHLRRAQVTSAAEGPNLISRWHWLGYELDQHLLLRAGRLNLPFGVRVSEHVLWARDFTKTDRESDQQHGAALAYWGEQFRAEFMLVLGNYQVNQDKYRQRGYSAFWEYLFSSRLAVGASSLILQSQADPFIGRDERTLRHAHGVTLRYGPIPELAFLGEANLLKTTSRSLGTAGFLMVDYEPVQSLHFMLTGEFGDEGQRDAGPSVPGAGETLLGYWASVTWFVYSHLDFRLDFVMRDTVADRVQGQLHFYF